MVGHGLISVFLAIFHIARNLFDITEQLGTLDCEIEHLCAPASPCSIVLIRNPIIPFFMDVGFILSRIIRRSLLLRGVNAIESGKKCSAGSVGDDDVEHRRLDIELKRT